MLSSTTGRVILPVNTETGTLQVRPLMLPKRSSHVIVSDSSSDFFQVLIVNSDGGPFWMFIFVQSSRHVSTFEIDLSRRIFGWSLRRDQFSRSIRPLSSLASFTKTVGRHGKYRTKQNKLFHYDC